MKLTPDQLGEIRKRVDGARNYNGPPECEPCLVDEAEDLLAHISALEAELESAKRIERERWESAAKTFGIGSKDDAAAKGDAMSTEEIWSQDAAIKHQLGVDP